MIEKVQGNHGHQGTGEIPPGFGIQGAAKEGISAELVQQVADILAGKSVDVSVVDRIVDDIVAQLSVPELEPANAAALAVDVALLAELMKIDGEKYKAKIEKALVDKQNADIDAQTKEFLANVNKTLKEMDKAAKMSKFMSIFGWLMVAVSVAVAAVTCGAAGGLVAGAVIAAATSTCLQCLNQFGVTAKLTEAIAKALKDKGVDERTAEIVSAVFVALVEIALSIVSGKIGDAIASKFDKLVKAGMKAGLTLKQAEEVAMRLTVMRTMDFAMKSLEKMCRHLPKIKAVVEYLMKVIGVSGQIGSADANYDYGVAKSEETKQKAILKEMMKVLQEMMDSLEEILTQLMNGDSDIAKILMSADEGMKDMMRRTPNMA